jgi:hypothetical protein
MRFQTWAIRVLAIGILAATAALAPAAKHEVGALSPAFDQYLAGVGEWATVSSEKLESGDEGAVVKQSRLYRGPSGEQVAAIFIATATRLGGLRDYSVAVEAQGWVRGNEDIVEGPPIPSLGEPMRYRLEHLHQGDKLRLALTWFVSSRRQARDLAGAEFGGWTDLITQSRPPVWVEVYATLDVAKDEAATRKTLTDFATSVGPAMARLAQNESEQLAAAT